MSSRHSDWFSKKGGKCPDTEHQYLAVTVQYLCRVEKILMRSNVLLLYFSPSQASSSQNLNVDSYLLYCEVDSLKPSKSESSLIHKSVEILSYKNQ